MTTHDDGSDGESTTGGAGPRRTRPIAERTAPDRAWVGRPRVADPASGARPPGADPSGPGEDAAYRTLNQAYGLVDEYLRQGQKMAEAVWLPLSGIAGGGEPGTAAPERFMRAMGDMTMAWVEVMQQWTSGPQRGQAATGTAGPFAAGAAPARPAAPSTGGPASQAVSVSVVASGRVEVTVDVAAGADPAQLVPTELRAYPGESPPIEDVSLVARAGEPALVRITVPDGHPPGTYSGLLLEAESRRPRGTISVVVLERTRT